VKEPPAAVPETTVPDLEIGSDEGLGFEAFFDRHYASVAKAVMLIVGDGHEAEDLVEEAFARAWERWDRVRVMASPVGYVYRTAVNLNRNRLRRIGRELRRLRAPDSAPDPASIAEVRDDVRRALAALPVAQREAIVLVGWFGMDVEAAAAVLGLKPSSLRSRVHRARSALREQFGGLDE
jgi:RNA polymerase sigma-70 factor (sigma-E family)